MSSTKSAIAGGQTFVSTASARIWSRSLMSLYGQIWMIWFSVPTSVRQKPASGEQLDPLGDLVGEGLLGLRHGAGLQEVGAHFEDHRVSPSSRPRPRLHAGLKAGITSLAKRSSCSSVTASGVPSGMAQMTRSRPG